jgi:hypothetical protein
MQHSKEAKCNTKIVSAKFKECFPNRLEQKLKRRSFVEEHKTIQAIGERKHRMEVRNRQ